MDDLKKDLLAAKEEIATFQSAKKGMVNEPAIVRQVPLPRPSDLGWELFSFLID